MLAWFFKPSLISSQKSIYSFQKKYHYPDWCQAECPLCSTINLVSVTNHNHKLQICARQLSRDNFSRLLSIYHVTLGLPGLQWAPLWSSEYEQRSQGEGQLQSNQMPLKLFNFSMQWGNHNEFISQGARIGQWYMGMEYRSDHIRRK